MTASLLASGYICGTFYCKVPFDIFPPPDYFYKKSYLVTSGNDFLNTS